MLGTIRTFFGIVTTIFSSIGRESRTKVVSLNKQVDLIKGLSVDSSSMDILSAIHRIQEIENEIGELNQRFDSYAQKKHPKMHERFYKNRGQKCYIVNELYFTQILKDLTKTMLRKIQIEKGKNVFVSINGQPYQITKCLEIIQCTKQGPSFVELEPLVRSDKNSDMWKNLPTVDEVKAYLPDGSVLDPAEIFKSTL